MARLISLAEKRHTQWLADLHEELELLRYPTRVEMLRAIHEAAQRADSQARLDHALHHLSAAR